MRRFLIILVVFLFVYENSEGQLFMTKNGFIGFYSKTPLEDIKAENNQVYAVIDVGKKNIAVSLLMKGFLFTKELMQEHFNENYVESSKYPKAVFTGSYNSDVSLEKPGTYPVTVTGTLTLHGVSKPLQQVVMLEVKEGMLSGHAQFKIKPEDFNINIPSIVRDKIAKEMNVNVNFECNPVKR